MFLNEVMGLQLDPALEARTEGWAAGLQLAALSARTHAGAADGSGDVAGFVEAFSGSHRFVLDHLVDEVLGGQPEVVRTFLLDTCVLDQMTGGLCDAMTGRSDGQSLLETLERGDLFVVPLDDERQWYRYHHLFADALRARLAGRHADRAGELHAAASRWLAENGLLSDAVRHAIASGDHERAADLVELTLADMRRRRQDRTLRDWLVALPDEVVRRRPLLATFMGWSRLWRAVSSDRRLILPLSREVGRLIDQVLEAIANELSHSFGGRSVRRSLCSGRSSTDRQLGRAHRWCGAR